MEKLKILAAAVFVSSVLMLVSPAVLSADNINQMPPAVVFVQDENERMLVYHNFASDNGFMIPWNTDVDNGIWAETPGSDFKYSNAQ